jgi:hypothetical protein
MQEAGTGTVYAHLTSHCPHAIRLAMLEKVCLLSQIRVIGWSCLVLGVALPACSLHRSLCKLPRDLAATIHFFLKPDPAAPATLRLDSARAMCVSA